MITPQDLDAIPALAPLSRDDKAWLAAQATERVAEAGAVLFEQGQPADRLFFLLRGTIVFRAVQDGQEAWSFVVEAGAITGMLPRSRMTHWTGTARAAEPVRAAVFRADQVGSLVERIPELDDIFAAALADRIRETTRQEQQRDKLMALGKLSAGLAHELNNPAAAIGRTVAALQLRLADLPARMADLLAHRLAPDQVADVRSAEEGGRLSAVARAEREDALAYWLRRNGIDSPDALAETFVEAGLDEQALEAQLAAVAREARPAVLRWTASVLAADLMLREIAASAERITGIVQSVKRYSRMDEAPAFEPTDVHEGIESTLTMLAHEVKSRGVRLVRQYAPDLPRIEAVAGQLNQVWTNLIDNALGAMPRGGTLKIVTRAEDEAVLIEIIDSGSGIPEDVQARVFEPFFTTKRVGEGTGLGLDVVHRIVTTVHGGQITLRSEPGCTNFTVRLPIHAPANGKAGP